MHFDPYKILIKDLVLLQLRYFSLRVYYSIFHRKILVWRTQSTRDENILLYISGCKPCSMSRFYGVELA